MTSETLMLGMLALSLIVGPLFTYGVFLKSRQKKLDELIQADAVNKKVGKAASDANADAELAMREAMSRIIRGGEALTEVDVRAELLRSLVSPAPRTEGGIIIGGPRPRR